MTLVNGTVNQCLYFSIASRQKRLPTAKTTPPLAIHYHGKLLFWLQTIKPVLCAKLIYRCRVSFGKLFSTIHITQCLFDTKAGLSLLNARKILQKYEHCIKSVSIQKKQTPTRRTLHVVGKKILYIHFGCICAWVLFVTVSYLVVGMLFGTSFINSLVRGIILFKLKCVSWHSLPVPALSQHWKSKPTASQEATVIKESTLAEHAEKSLASVCIARRIVPKLRTLHRVLNTTFNSSILTARPKILEKCRQMMPTAYGVVGAFSLHAFHILLSNNFLKAIPLPKRKVVAYAANPTRAAATPKSSPRPQHSAKTNKRVDKTTRRNFRSTECDNKTVNSEGKDRINETIGAVYYKSSTDKK